MPAADESPLVWIDGVDPRTPALFFRNPLDVIQADEPRAVSAALARLDRAVAAGRTVAGYLAYEALAPESRFSETSSEPHSDRHPHDANGPLLWFGVFAGSESGEDPAAPENEIAAADGDAYSLRPAPGGVDEHEERAQFMAAVERIRGWIERGEVYQVNYTRHTEFDFEGDPLALYRLLRRLQPADYRAFVRHPGRAILSCSPELFLEMRGERTGAVLETRPIKGTVARAADPARDRQRVNELRADPKNRAENAMIVDLLRNDLGVHARPGSVEVADLFRVESLPTLHQLVSTVRGRIDAQRRRAFFRELVPALFPCGSITGAPKRAARLFIEELESAPRGVYTGAVGWLGPAGGAFNVAIRTLDIGGPQAGGAQLNGPRRARFGSGCGIVWDSRAADEWREYQLKRSFLLPALDGFHVFTTLRYESGRVLFLRDHLRRLRRAARRFAYPWSFRDLRADWMRATAGLDASRAWRIRIALDRTGRFRIETSELDQAFGRGGRRVRVVLSPHAIHSGDPFRRWKSSRRELYDREFERVRAAGCDDVLFRNEEGAAVESATSNLLVLDASGRWLTPGPDAGALPGIYLKNLMRRRAGAPRPGRSRRRIEFARLTPDELRRARAVLVCNAVRGLRRVEFVPES